MFYGAYALFDYNDDPLTTELSLAVYANMTSTGAAPVFGAAGLQQIMRSFTGLDQATITFNNMPLPGNAVFTVGTQPSMS
jgi:hypothetical protein